MSKREHLSRHKHRRIHKKDAIKAGVIFCGAVLLLVVAAFGIQSWQDSHSIVENAGQEVANATAQDAPQQQIEYDDVLYQRKDAVEAYLFMGIDESGPVRSNKSYVGGGQADFQLLLVVDHESQTWQLLQFNRDSMVEVPVLGVLGTEIGTEYQQLALAHTYGEGLKDSCMNNVAAVSRMLGNQPIDGYISLNMDAVMVLNDLVGGVTVTIESDFSEVDPTLVMGETVTLQGEQALHFVRTRKNVDDETNLARMKRQRQYLSALIEKMLSQDTEIIVEGYEAVWDYMVTDMGSRTLVDLAEQIKGYEELDTLTIDGENYLDSHGFMAYDLDEDSLQQTIRKLFYRPVS